MKKTFRIICTFFLTVIVLSLSACTNHKSTLSSKIFEEYKEEYQKLNADISPVTAFDFSNSVPVYFYKYDPDIEHDTLAERITEYYIFESKTEQEKSIYAPISSGKWTERIPVSLPVYTDKYKKPIDIQLTMDWFVQRAVESFDGEIDDVKVVCYNQAYLIYFISNSTEYAIAYSPNPELFEVENGKIYTAKEIISIVNHIGWGCYNIDDPTIYGG